MTTICFYDEEKKTLSGGVYSKARRFCKLNLVEPQGHDNLYLVKHIPGYNKTDHAVDLKNKVCTCQANALYNKTCSHLLAASLFKKTREEQ